MSEPPLISTAAISAGSRNKVAIPDQQMGQLTRSFGNMIVSSSTYANILKLGISRNHTKTTTNKPVEERRNPNTKSVCFAQQMPYKRRSRYMYVTKTDKCKKCGILGHKKAECNGWDHEVAMQILKEKN